MTLATLLGLVLGNISILPRHRNIMMCNIMNCCYFEDTAIPSVQLLHFLHNCQVICVITRLKQEIHVDIKHQTEGLTATCAAKDAYYFIHTNALSSDVSSTSQDINTTQHYLGPTRTSDMGFKSSGAYRKKSSALFFPNFKLYTPCSCCCHLPKAIPKSS